MKNDNFITCKRIADELEAYANDEIRRCPECGELIPYEESQYNGEKHEYTCQACSAAFDADDLEVASLYDYFSDALDIEYRIGSDKEYRSVRIMISCGGPNIYINTGSRRVELYWWNEAADRYLSAYCCDMIDEIFSEMYSCL